jgi:hypothetical protein
MDGASYMDLNVKSLRDEFIELDEDIVREVLRSANQDCEIARDKLFELAGRKRPKPEVSRSIETGFSLEEHKGDMFAFAAANTCLAHCVSVDMAMGKGIAIEFKKRFGGVGEIYVMSWNKKSSFSSKKKTN